MIAFREAMEAAGITPPDEIVADGAIHRFRMADERRGKQSGWYVFHADDPPAGAFGDWRNSETYSWCAKNGSLTPEERAHYHERIEAARRERDAQLAAEREAAAVKAARIWAAAQPADPAHPYLTRKGVKPHGIRQDGDQLIIPVRTPAGELTGLQFIGPDGTKRFLAGTAKRGNCFLVGGSTPSIVCEGFATGATVHEATGATVAVAFDAGNLKLVARAFPSIVTVAADNDPAGLEGAGATGLRVVAPDEPRKDWNDRGLDAARAAFSDAVEPSRRVIEHPEPLRLAEDFIKTHHYRPQGKLDLRRWRNDWLRYTGAAYEVEDEESIRARMYRHLDTIWTPYEDPKTGEEKLRKLAPKPRHVTEVLDAMPAVGPLVTSDMPAWLDGEEAKRPPATEFVACANGLLHLPSQVLHPHTPHYFSTTVLPFDYDPDAPEPSAFLQFLAEIFDGEADAIQLLREWFGYCLATDTRHQKILMLVGPKRSGKGTIARVLTALLGQANVCSPTLAGLASHFGMQSLIGKSVAIIGDARLSTRTDISQVTERLLSISGEDIQTVARKNRTDWVGYLPVRFMLLTNELPRLQDQSGALASRFLILPMRKSFYGREDHGLFDRLAAELPGILNWALDGYERLQERGRFAQPACAATAIRELEDLSSPVGAFVRDCCDVGPEYDVTCDAIFAKWKSWCEAQGREHAGNMASFGRDLRSVIPGLERRQVRDLTNRQTRIYKYQGVKINEY